MTGAFAALVEAWGEVKVHKVRVVLSLIGVMLAVLAMTVVTALGDMLRQANAEQNERWSGRAATLNVGAYTNGGSLPDDEVYAQAFADLLERYEITYATTVTYGEQTFRFREGSALVQSETVDVDYGAMFRIRLDEGRWFDQSDVERYAPTAIVNHAFLNQLGVSDLSSNPTVMLGGQRPVRVTIIGVVNDNVRGGDTPFAYLLKPAVERWAGAGAGGYGGPPEMRMWVPPDQVDLLTERIPRDLKATLPAGTEVNVYRSDSDDFAKVDAQIRWGIRGAAAIALALGSLALVNVALVTVRYRIREIGIRRSFGATSSRVFFGVMMESIWATVVAGLVGVALAVAIVKNLPPSLFDLDDLPGFPVRAAVEGMIAATLVGALAGLTPAIVAVRIKVIDAIRY